MTWSPQQEAAIKDVKAWLRDQVQQPVRPRRRVA